MENFGNNSSKSKENSQNNVNNTNNKYFNSNFSSENDYNIDSVNSINSINNNFDNRNNINNYDDIDPYSNYSYSNSNTNSNTNNYQGYNNNLNNNLILFEDSYFNNNNTNNANINDNIFSKKEEERLLMDKINNNFVDPQVFQQSKNSQSMFSSSQNNQNNINNQIGEDNNQTNTGRNTMIPDKAVVNINSNDFYYDNTNQENQYDYSEIKNNNMNTISSIFKEVLFEIDSQIQEMEINNKQLISKINFNILSTLRSVLKNIISNPGEYKFRELRYSNSKISLLLQIPGIKEFLCIIGFDDIILNSESSEKALLLLDYKKENLECAFSVVEELLKTSGSNNNKINNPFLINNNNTGKINNSNSNSFGNTNTANNSNNISNEYLLKRNKKKSEYVDPKKNILNLLKETASVRGKNLGSQNSNLNSTNNNTNNNISNSNNSNTNNSSNINSSNNNLGNNANNSNMNSNSNNNLINKSINNNIPKQNSNISNNTNSNNIRNSNTNNNNNRQIKDILRDTAYIRMQNSRGENNMHTLSSLNNNTYNINNGVSNLSDKDFINSHKSNSNNNEYTYNNKESVLSTQPSDKFDSIGKECLRLSNEFRKRNGLNELKWDSNIWIISYGHSKDMATGKVPFGHQGFNKRIASLPFSFEQANENVFMCSGYDYRMVAAAAVEGWIKSPGHRKNLLSYTNFCAIACYNVYDSFYLTQIFIRR